MSAYDEYRLAELLRRLPPAPDAWLRAAQELPLARDRLDEISARASEDVRFRAALIADLERALADAGYEPDRRLVDALRARFAAG
jgi:hypothetical protein